jgi:hypothetical protein
MKTNADYAQPSIDSDQPAPVPTRYPLLEALLAERGLNLKGTYTYPDLVRILGGSKRALQDAVRDGKLRYRSLPGRAHWLSIDIEEFLQNSLKPVSSREANR